jgi:hypothetical protein
VAFAVVLLLAGGVAPVYAAGSARPVNGKPGLAAGVAALWAWIGTALSAGPLAQTAACDKGSYIDPDGGCRTAAAAPAGGTTADTDKGSSIDPNGG